MQTIYSVAVRMAGEPSATYDRVVTGVSDWALAGEPAPENFLTLRGESEIAGKRLRWDVVTVAGRPHRYCRLELCMPLADAEGAEFVCDVVIAQTADETAFGVELALYFSDDAITLENELHAAFAARRLNHANSRKEFFFATPEEVRDVFAEKVGNLLEYAARPEAEQYYQSVSSWPAAAAGRPGS